MLQKVAQDRLDKVLAVIKMHKFRFANKEISERLGIGKGTVSDYLNGAKPISEKFYESFMANYDIGNSLPNEVVNSAIDSSSNTNKAIDDDKMDIIKQLVHSGIVLSNANNTMSEANKIIAEANRTLANNNEDLIDIIKNSNNSTIPKTAKEIQIQGSLNLSRTFEDLAKAGVPDKWATIEEGLLFLSRLLHEAEEEKRASGMYSEKDNSNKAFS